MRRVLLALSAVMLAAQPVAAQVAAPAVVAGDPYERVYEPLTAEEDAAVEAALRTVFESLRPMRKGT